MPVRKKAGFRLPLLLMTLLFGYHTISLNAMASNAAHQAPQVLKKIQKIIVNGNKLVPTNTILARIPYHVGDVYKPQKSRQLINGLYKIGLLSCIKLEAQELSPQEIALFVTLQEKQPIAEFTFSGNKHLKREDINKKIALADIKALDEGELANLVSQIKKLYAEKDYHHVTVNPRFVTTDERTVAHFDIEEGAPTHVQRVFITGNKQFKSKQLRALLFTRENWVLGFLNKAGSYQPDALDYDKSLIENFYHNNGYLAAQVKDVTVEPVPNSCDVNVTFSVEENDQYCIESVKAPGNSLLSEEELLSAIPIKPGQLYSKELIRQTLEALRTLWGEYGYIYAEVEPSVIPDEKTKTVAIEFHTNLGSCIRLNRITFIGNKKTRDKVIRRQLLLDEGELLTTRKLDLSKERVQALGYFDQRNGVNWKIIRIDDERADLELMLNEVKTGQFYAQIGTGGIATDKNSPSQSFTVSVGAQDSNILGLGWQGNLSIMYSRQDRSLNFSLVNPWLFDRPLYGGCQFFHRRSNYDEFNGTRTKPSELSTGGSGQIGFTIQKLASTNAMVDVGAENIHFNQVTATLPGFQPLLNRKFQSGKLVRLGINVVQDLRNHPVMPSRGYIWTTGIKMGVPLSSSCFSYIKWELDGQWYTPLINEYDLILRLHGLFGIVKPIKNHTLPYRELYHIGGPATVRGFLFGQIGPNLVDVQNGINDSLGAEKAFVVNAELLFPIARDGSIRGVVFYDGGAGWDTPDKNLIPCGLRNDRFNFRHAIGIGVRLTRPSPVRLDIGFKLDRKKRLNESLSEVHFTMAQDF
jgi:outer membrane protein insertion porin family